MTFDGDLVGAIYEAGAMPERWPGMLMQLAGTFGARGGNLIRRSADGVMLVSSESVATLAREFDRQGWNERNSRIDRLLARASHPGFLTDSDLHSEEELRTLPIYTEFLTPNGAAAGAASIVQGAGDDGLVLAIEGFFQPCGLTAGRSRLDALRPHLARAMVLSGQLHLQRIRAAMAALQAIHVGAALLDRQGRPQAVNPLFEHALGSQLHDRKTRLHAADPVSDRRLAAALETLVARGEGSSTALRGVDAGESLALHLIPLRGDARDIFSGSAGIAALASPRNSQVPDAGLIQALFDITPAEARVARAVAQGKAPAAIATESGLTVGTVRFQLKQVFHKTGTRKQSELAVLLKDYARPE